MKTRLYGFANLVVVIFLCSCAGHVTRDQDYAIVITLENNNNLMAPGSYQRAVAFDACPRSDKLCVINCCTLQTPQVTAVKSDNPEIVSIDNSLILHAKGLGKTTVHVSAEHPKNKVLQNIDVTVAPVDKFDFTTDGPPYSKLFLVGSTVSLGGIVAMSNTKGVHGNQIQIAGTNLLRSQNANVELVTDGAANAYRMTLTNTGTATLYNAFTDKKLFDVNVILPSQLNGIVVKTSPMDKGAYYTAQLTPTFNGLSLNAESIRELVNNYKSDLYSIQSLTPQICLVQIRNQAPSTQLSGKSGDFEIRKKTGLTTGSCTVRVRFLLANTSHDIKVEMAR